MPRLPRCFPYIRCSLPPSGHQPDQANSSTDRSIQASPKSTRIEVSKKSLSFMDKVLAFSILSASPADIAAGSWARLSWRGRKQDDKAGQGQQGGEPAEAKQKQQRGKGNSQPQPPRGEVLWPRFAPEFDGIDCFQTIVSH